jgi:protein-S-isoprenylcysteine O-methyltransferase Ste14
MINETRICFRAHSPLKFPVSQACGEHNSCTIGAIEVGRSDHHSKHTLLGLIRRDRSSIMKPILFLAALTLEIFYTLMFVLTIRLPYFRFWPPPSHRSWQFFVSWLTASLVTVVFLFLGLLDFDSFFLHSWLRVPAAFGLLVFTSITGSWSFLTLGLRSTIGLGDRLITTGPYRYSRNPQYLGDSLSIVAYMIFTNSWMVWILGLLGVMLNILAPFTEESWLEERFGLSYLQYKGRVPRFIRLKKMDDTF